MAEKELLVEEGVCVVCGDTLVQTVTGAADVGGWW